MSQFSLGARVLIAMFVTCGLAQARPLNARDSFPAAEAILDGRNAQYFIRFDGWVDSWRCADGRHREREDRRAPRPTRDSEPDVLAASAPALPLGRYQLHWHTKSVPDGGVSEGSFPSQSRGDFAQVVIFARRRLGPAHARSATPLRKPQ